MHVRLRNGGIGEAKDKLERYGKVWKEEEKKQEMCRSMNEMNR